MRKLLPLILLPVFFVAGVAFGQTRQREPGRLPVVDEFCFRAKKGDPVDAGQGGALQASPAASSWEVYVNARVHSTVIDEEPAHCTFTQALAVGGAAETAVINLANARVIPLVQSRCKLAP